ncbi:adenosylcobinamide-GDP ribazoletransferase [Marinitoga sp. 1137]|uniref:adenosylcobinamide-GDP ribazoletransferase n=1 Tax=Marinitoga sp. 1137 TaxID=1545835 RepID=UPI0009FB935C|nr:adenosylcobinamide-GDP ribazoletransferase [Marinitoga sp. 1137]
MKDIMKGIILIITFFTRIPIKYEFEFSEKYFKKGIIFFPIVGLFIGIMMFLILRLSNYLDKSIVIFFTWIFYIWITGGIHLDGVADSFDGLFSNRKKERILEIMKDSRIGTFGVIGLLIVLGFEILMSYYSTYSVIIMPMVSRSVLIFISSITIYAGKKDGLGNIFIDNCNLKKSIISFLMVILVAVFLNIKLIFAVIGTYIFSYMILKYIEKRINGITGDIAGLIIESSQGIYLFLSYIILLGVN